MPIDCFVESSVTRQQLLQQQAINPLIKMESWPLGDHDDYIDDSTDELLDELERVEEEIAVRCGKGGYKKKGKKGGKWGR